MLGEITGQADIKEIQGHIADLPRWAPAIVRTHWPALGQAVVGSMQAALANHRYTGDLSDSVSSTYDDADWSVTISPKAMRGAYDGGLLLEFGSAPHRAPFGPIKAWADFRGLPAGAIWQSIATQGIRAHPFLDFTLHDAQPHVTETVRRILTEVAHDLLWGGGTESLR